MIRLSSTVKKFLRNESKFSRTYFSTKVVTEDSDRFIFPRETEGNNYKVNWSMTEDGVTPVGDAFRNARFELLASRLGLPTQANSTISISSTILFGSYNITEAGDSITHDDFQDFKSAQSSYLSSGLDLYVEDASLGALSDIRVGVRIISSNPVLSLIYRNLLVNPYNQLTIVSLSYSALILLFRFRLLREMWTIELDTMAGIKMNDGLPVCQCGMARIMIFMIRELKR